MEFSFPIYVLYCWKSDLFLKKNIVIRLPEGIIPAIANSFISLLPVAAVILLIWFIQVSICSDITKFLQIIFSLLVFGLNTIWGLCIHVLIMCLLWTVGIHERLY